MKNHVHLAAACSNSRYDMVSPRVLDLVFIIDDLAIGGAQRVFEVQLRAMVHGPYSIRVINLSGPTPMSERIKALGIELIEIQQRKLFDLSSWKALRAIIGSWRPQIIHAHLTHATIVGAILSRMIGARFFVTLHSQGPDRQGWRDSVKNMLERFALTYGADHIVACGPRVAKMQLKRVGRTPMSVIENRIEKTPQLSRNELSRIRSSLGYSSDDIVVISVGRLTPGKGFDILIRAFRSITRKFPTAKLLIVGGGDDQNRLIQIINTAEAGQYVKMVGPRSDVNRLMAAADVFVLPSLWEGLPMVLLEAMAAELPIIATDVGDVATVIGNGAGILIRPGDEGQLAEALSELVGKAEMRTALSEQSKYAARKYTDLDSFSKELHSVYFDNAQWKYT